jgi:hypothetical protein
MIQLARGGYIFHFHWVPRSTIGLNIHADKVAGIARAVIAEVPQRYERETGQDIDHAIYMINASA